jgi:hypothetical protein
MYVFIPCQYRVTRLKQCTLKQDKSKKIQRLHFVATVIVEELSGVDIAL